MQNDPRSKFELIPLDIKIVLVTFVACFFYYVPTKCSRISIREWSLFQRSFKPSRTEH